MTRAIRVAFLLDSFKIGGSELNAIRTAESLMGERVNLTVFHLVDEGEVRDRYEELGVEIIHIPLRSLYHPSTIWQGIRLAREVRKRQIDVVHAHDVYTNIFALPFLRLLTRAKLIASRRWGATVFPAHFNAANRFAMRFAHRVLANSSSVAGLLVDEDGVPARKIVTLSNFVDDEAFIDEEDVRSPADFWQVPQGSLVVGIVARLDPVKNHRSLVDAIELLPDTVHLVIVGDGPAADALQTYVDQSKAGSRVHLQGAIPPGSYPQRYFDIAVLCSLDEGFPNSIVESLAVGTPVVATDVGGVKDAISDGECGFLVPPNDVTALADRIRQLCEDSQLRMSMGTVGRMTAKRKFGREAVIDELVSVYRKLAIGEG